MYNTSQNFIDELNRASRTFRARLTFDGGQVLTSEIRSLVFNGGSCGADNFSIGSIFIGYLDMILSDVPINIAGKEFLAEIGLDLPDETTEYIPMGVYSVKPADITVSRNLVTAKAQDRLGWIGTAMYDSSIEFPATVGDVLVDLSTVIGVTVETSIDTTGIIEKKMTGITVRDALQYISCILGGFVCCGRTGNIVISEYSKVAKCTYGSDRMYSCTTGEEFEVTGITVVVTPDDSDEEGQGTTPTSYFAAGSDVVLLVENPYMTEDLFNTMAPKVVGYSYLASSVQMLGDPRLDPEDAVIVTDYRGITHKVPCMLLTHDYDGGLTTSISSPGKTISSDDSQGPMSKRVEGLSMEVATMRELIADKASIEYLIGGEGYFRGKITANSGEFGTTDNYYYISEEGLIGAQRLRKIRVYEQSGYTIPTFTSDDVIEADYFLINDFDTRAHDDIEAEVEYDLNSKYLALYIYVPSKYTDDDLLEMFKTQNSSDQITMHCSVIRADGNIDQGQSTFTLTGSNVPIYEVENADGYRIKTGTVLGYDYLKTDKFYSSGGQFDILDDDDTALASFKGNKISFLNNQLILGSIEADPSHLTSAFNYLRSNAKSMYIWHKNDYCSSEMNFTRSMDGKSSSAELRAEDLDGIHKSTISVSSGAEAQIYCSYLNDIYASIHAIASRNGSEIWVESSNMECVLGKNNILWGNATSSAWMDGDTTIHLNEPISKQLSGAIFAWSNYNNGIANTNWHYFFVPKSHVLLGNTTADMYDPYMGMYKLLEIRDEYVKGRAINSQSGTLNGFAYNNTRWTLRYVLGV